jgi:S1-C subfamily serine protease
MLALASVCLCTFAGAARASELVDRIVRVRAVGVDGTVNVGSGVIVAPRRIATTCHVTRRATAITVTYAGQRLQATDEIGSELHDLCLLRVPATDLTDIRTRRSDDLLIGEPVTAIGFEGAGREAIVQPGVVIGLYRYDGGYVIRTNATFDFGSSGGGLFDRFGNFIGILAFKARRGENLRFALPSDWLSPTSQVAESFAAVSGTSGAVSTFWERPQGDRPAFLGVALREAAGNDH